MSPLANLLSRGKEETDASIDVSDLPAPALTVFARVNLLPPEIEEAERFRREQVGRGAVLVVALGAVVLGVISASAQVSQGQESVDTAAAQAVVLQSQVQALAEVPLTAAELKIAQAQRYGALGQEVRWSQYLNGFSLVTGKLDTQVQTMVVTQAVDPPSAGAGGPVSFTGLPGIATVTYAGIAKSNKDVSYFLDSLVKQKGNVDPSFTSAAAGTDAASGKEVVNFNATVTVTDQAESGRYPQTGE